MFLTDLGLTLLKSYKVQRYDSVTHDNFICVIENMAFLV